MAYASEPQAAGPLASKPGAAKAGLALSGLKGGLLVAALAVFPFLVTNPYYLHLAVLIFIFSILLLGLDVVFGYTGEVSLGHAALLGIGAYTAGVLNFQLGIGMVAALPVASWSRRCSA